MALRLPAALSSHLMTATHLLPKWPKVVPAGRCLSLFPQWWLAMCRRLQFCAQKAALCLFLFRLTLQRAAVVFSLAGKNVVLWRGSIHLVGSIGSICLLITALLPMGIITTKPIPSVLVPISVRVPIVVVETWSSRHFRSEPVGRDRFIRDCLVSTIIDENQHSASFGFFLSQVIFLFSARGIVSIFTATEWSPMFLCAAMSCVWQVICHEATTLRLSGLL